MIIETRMRRFYLQRDKDVHGISGTGRVGEGVVFSDGTCALRWLTKTASTAVYQSVEDLIYIHDHRNTKDAGGTYIEWLD